MTPRMTTDYAKNYCNRTLIVKVIVENVITIVFYGTQCSTQTNQTYNKQIYKHKPQQIP